MTIGRLLTIIIVLGVIGGAAYYFMGDEIKDVAQDAAAAADSPLGKAEALYYKGSYAEAAAAYQAVLDDPKDDDQAKEALYGVARSWDKAEDGKKAVPAYKSFMEKYPDDQRVADAEKRIGYHELSGP